MLNDLANWPEHPVYSRRISDISLRGKRLKRKGKGVLGVRETRGVRKEGGNEGVSFPPSSRARSRFSRA